MKFDYNSYCSLIDLLKTHSYKIANYNNYKDYDKCVILRHDIDNSIDKAVEFAQYEKALGVYSTFFVLVTSDLYNIHSRSNSRKLMKIMESGCKIGLHFDEMNYPNIIGDSKAITKKILYEKIILENAINSPINTFSFHRPSKAILDENLTIPGMINSYEFDLKHGFKYLSDSRRRWREPIENVIASEQFNQFHILTHAFWYNIQDENINCSINKFINKANLDRYEIMKLNITDIESIMTETEILQ